MKTITRDIFRKQPRREETDYADTFLKKKELKTRQYVYISRDMHGIVSRITGMFPDRDITVGSYIDLCNTLKRIRTKSTNCIKRNCKKEKGKT
jgi:hypothetical protein